MNAKKIDISLFMCKKCGKNWAAEKGAEDCCKKGTCKYCGAETPFVYVSVCGKCRKEWKAIREGKILYAYEDGFNFQGPVYDPISEEFFESLDYLKEAARDMGEDFPPYVVKCNVLNFKIDANKLVGDAFEDYASQLGDPDALEIVDFGELVEFVEEWNKKQRAEIWEPSDTVVILSEEWLAKTKKKFEEKVQC